MYVDAFANRDMTLRFAKAASEQVHRKSKDYFGISSLEEQDSVLETAGTIQFLADVSDALVDDEVVSAALDGDDD